jgi:hypothetical protein
VSLPEQASIMMLASDFWHTDFAITQDHSSLLVWLRRPGSDASGDPPFTVDKALQPRRWNSVDVVVSAHASILIAAANVWASRSRWDMAVTGRGHGMANSASSKAIDTSSAWS